VILRGAGANFSAGYDMNEVLEHLARWGLTPV
jgi:enoyl-CoA hydratase/carnithine racemase